jgi:hypothetical protein
MISQYQYMHTISLQCYEYKISSFNNYSDVHEYIKIFTNQYNEFTYKCG